LQFYTDYNYINDDIDSITQKKNCSISYTEDAYTSSKEACQKYFSSYNFNKEITQVLSNNNRKTCFSFTMNVNNCTETDADCFVKGILNRYKSDEIYSKCTLDTETLTKNGFNNTQIYFQNRILNFLKMAKNELLLKSDLERKLAEYKSQFTSNIKNNVDVYVAKLNRTTIEYLSLQANLKKMVNYYENNYDSHGLSNNRKVYENFLSCSNYLINFIILNFN